MGRTWKPANRGLHVKKVWTVEVDPEVPSRLYAGTHCGHLFRSNDGGETWEEVTGLHGAPKRNEWGVDWGYGTTGLCIHTIRIDSANNKKLFVVASGRGLTEVMTQGRPGNFYRRASSRTALLREHQMHHKFPVELYIIHV